MKDEKSHGVGDGYAWYVLCVLVVVYVFNFIDRNILTILAEDIKADLGVTDAQIGFLYGTAFAVFYAIFGIPLGRLADVWVRRSLISVGLIFWSVMTALSGTARSFTSLAVFRFGVGIGEASASPAAFSMLSDYFPPRLRATAISIYSSGIYIGAGIGVFLGGLIVDNWNDAYPGGQGAPFELKGWQAAFMAVGLPGVLLGIWVRFLKEPVRGISEGVVTPDHPAPFRTAFDELMTVLPPLTFLALARAGAGTRGVLINLAGAAFIAALAWVLVWLTSDVAQWVALGIGVYCAFCWVQTLAYRDPPTFAMIFRSRTLPFAVVGFASISFVTYGIGAWAPSYFQRVHDVSAGDVGIYFGLPAALGGWIGVTAGGAISDLLKQRSPRARIWVGLGAALVALIPGLTMLYTESITVAFVASFFFSIFSPMWVGCAATTVADLVLPRMRGVASAFYILMNTFIGLALGPYLMGAMSDAFAADGMASGDALRLGMACGFFIFVLVIACLLNAARFIEDEENTRVERARAAGEVIEPDASEDAVQRADA